MIVLLIENMQVNFHLFQKTLQFQCFVTCNNFLQKYKNARNTFEKLTFQFLGFTECRIKEKGTKLIASFVHTFQGVSLICIKFRSSFLIYSMANKNIL